MTESQRMNVAIAKQEAATIAASCYDRIDGVGLARLGHIIALLGEVLGQKDVAQVVLFEDAREGAVA